MFCYKVRDCFVIRINYLLFINPGGGGSVSRFFSLVFLYFGMRSGTVMAPGATFKLLGREFVIYTARNRPAPGAS